MIFALGVPCGGGWRFGIVLLPRGYFFLGFFNLLGLVELEARRPTGLVGSK